MKISELQVRQGNVEVEGEIKEIGEVRTFDKFGKQLRVATATLEDDSGNIKLALWNEDIDNFKKGDKVKVVNGFVTEFQGEKQLTSGKFGKLEKVDGESESAEPSESTEKLEEQDPKEDTEQEEKTE